MNSIAFLLALFIFGPATAQTTHVYDIVSFKLPQGWQTEEKENILTCTVINKNNNSWCQVSIIKSTISKGSIDDDFESEWQDLIVKNYKITESPRINDVQETEGWKIKAGVGKFIFNNDNAIAMLTTISGFNRCASIVSTTNNQGYIKDIEALLSSIELVKPANNPQPPADAGDSKSIIGTWGANASDNSNYRVKNGVMNYISRQYTFNANGTYSFVSKAFDPLMDQIILGKENGIYRIDADMLVITPKKSVLEAWSKKDGADKWGKLLNAQNIPLEKVSYHFTKHYFSGVKTWSLVLQADKATQRDGPFSNNASFNGAWYYGPISANNLAIKLPD